MKKLFNSLFALALLLVQIVPTTFVSAQKGTNSDNGKITINGAIEGKEYSVYQILQLESYDTEKQAYTYTITTDSDWYAFLTNVNLGGAYVKVDTENLYATENGVNKYIVTWKENADAKAFSEKALEYAKAEATKINPTASDTADDSGILEFTGLNLGYYLVDSSLGALLGLTTTKPTITINEKNSVPTVDKEVKENTSNEFGSENTDYIGNTIYFQTTINVGDDLEKTENKAGAQNYKLYDIMSTGLTLNENSIVVTLNKGTTNEKVLTKGTDYTVEFNKEIVINEETVKYAFVIDFTDEFEKSLNESDVMLVEYNAILNENAVVGSTGNTNKTHLEYGDDHKTSVDTTITYTYSFDLVKTDENNQILSGAIFKLYDKAENGKEILVKWDATNKVYRVTYSATTGDVIAALTEETTIDGVTYPATTVDGKVTIEGLDTGTYYLEEIKAPEGYNKLTSRVAVKIDNANNDATIKTETTTQEDGTEITTTTISGGAHIVNKTGAELPETGGIGTILFITIGSLLVLGFGVLLVTKLRISKMVA